MSTTDTKVMYVCKDRKRLREQPCTLADQNGCCTVTACIYYEGKLQYDAMVVCDPMPLKDKMTVDEAWQFIKDFTEDFQYRYFYHDWCEAIRVVEKALHSNNSL